RLARPARRPLDARRETIEGDLLLEAPLLVVERADARAAMRARRRVRLDHRRIGPQPLARAPPPQRQLTDVLVLLLRQIHASPSVARSRSRSVITLASRLRTGRVEPHSAGV